MLIKLIIEYKSLLTILIDYLNDINMTSKEIFIDFSLFKFFSVMIKFLRFYLVILINYLIIKGFVSYIWLIKFLLLISYIIISNKFVSLLIRRLLKSLALTFNSMIIVIFASNKIILLIIMILVRDNNSSYNHQQLLGGW